MGKKEARVLLYENSCYFYATLVPTFIALQITIDKVFQLF